MRVFILEQAILLHIKLLKEMKLCFIASEGV